MAGGRPHRRPPAAARGGLQPGGRPVRAAAGLLPVGPRQGDGGPRRRRARAATTSRSSCPRRWSAPSRPPRRSRSGTSLAIEIDPDLIEADNIFEGKRVSVGDGVLSSRRPGATCTTRSGRRGASPTTRWRTGCTGPSPRPGTKARGHEAVLVSHQLPIWIARLAAEERRLWHDPRSRQCTLASLTSLTYDGDTLAAITYTEPSRDLLAKASKVAGA